MTYVTGAQRFLPRGFSRPAAARPASIAGQGRGGRHIIGPGASQPRAAAVAAADLVGEGRGKAASRTLKQARGGQ